MKILYVSQFYYPERVAGAFRATDNSRIWSEDGHDVTVFTTYPNFPTGKVFSNYSNKLIYKEKKDKIKIIRSKIIAMKNTSKINRAIASISFLFFSIYNVIFNKNKIKDNYDVVIGTSGTILAPIIAYIYSRLYKVNFILELRDVTYNQYLAVYGKKNILYNLIKYIELFLCKKASKVVVVTKGFKDILVKDKIPSNKIEVIPNGAILKDDTSKKISNTKEKIVFSFIGNIGASQNLKNVIDIFNDLELKNIQKELLIIGDGGKKESLRDYIQNKKIKNVKLIDGMEYSELKIFYEMSDFCIVSLNNNNKFIETIPSKTFTIMDNKRPILYLGPKGEASKIIEESKCGLVYNSNDYKKVARQISEVINSYIENGDFERKIKEYGSLGYKYVTKNYNRENLAKKYIEVIERVIENDTKASR